MQVLSISKATEFHDFFFNTRIKIIASSTNMLLDILQNLEYTVVVKLLKFENIHHLRLLQVYLSLVTSTHFYKYWDLSYFTHSLHMSLS